MFWKKYKSNTDHLWEALNEESRVRENNHIAMREEFEDVHERIKDVEEKLDSVETKQELQGIDVEDIKSGASYQRRKLRDTWDEVVNVYTRIHKIERMQKTQNVILIIISAIVGGMVP